MGLRWGDRRDEPPAEPWITVAIRHYWTLYRLRRRKRRKDKDFRRLFLEQQAQRRAERARRLREGTR